RASTPVRSRKRPPQRREAFHSVFESGALCAAFLLGVVRASRRLRLLPVLTISPSSTMEIMNENRLEGKDRAGHRLDRRDRSRDRQGPRGGGRRSHGQWQDTGKGRGRCRRDHEDGAWGQG